MRYENRIEALLATATPAIGTIKYQAQPTANEWQVIHWLHRHLGGDILFLAPSTTFEVKSPDLMWRGGFVDIKHIQGNLNTLGNKIKKAMKQTSYHGVILEVSAMVFSDDEIIQEAQKKLARLNGSYCIIIRDERLIAYINRA